MISEKKKALSDEEFEKLLSEFDLNEKKRDIVYGVLVLGEKQRIYAEKYGVTISAISSLCTKVYNSFKKKKAGRLSDEEFEQLLNRFDLNERAKDITYGVLVLRKKQRIYAEKYSVTISSISALCRRVYNLFKGEVEEIPEGYERVNVILPEHKAFLVKKWAEKVSKDINK